MIRITREGDLGPIEALELRDELTRATGTDHPQIMLDLTGVTKLHPAVAAAIVHGASQVRNQTGSFVVVEPEGPEALRTLSLVSLTTLIR